MDRNKLIVRAVIVGLGLLALIEGWSLATAPRPRAPAAAPAAVNQTTR